MRGSFYLWFNTEFRKIMQSMSHGLTTMHIVVVFLFFLLGNLALILSNSWGQSKNSCCCCWQITPLRASFLSV